MVGCFGSEAAMITEVSNKTFTARSAPNFGLRDFAEGAGQNRCDLESQVVIEIKIFLGRLKTRHHDQKGGTALLYSQGSTLSRLL